MAGAGDGAKFDHVVSVMFENRTFDNLLGRLYQPGEVASFEQVPVISAIARGFATFDHAVPRPRPRPT